MQLNKRDNVSAMFCVCVYVFVFFFFFLAEILKYYEAIHSTM